MDANHAIWVEIEAIKQAQRRIGRIQDSRTGCRVIGLQDWGLQGYRTVQNNWGDVFNASSGFTCLKRAYMPQ